jgi:hypothetical protein
MLRMTLERLVNYCTPQGMKRQEEMMIKRMAEMRQRMPQGVNPYSGAAEAGWGAARKDLTWVKPPQRFGAPPPKKE